MRGTLDSATKDWSKWDGTVSSVELHQPSEHLVLGEGYPLEIQLYFASSAGKTEAAAAIMFKVVADWAKDDKEADAYKSTSVPMYTTKECKTKQEETDKNDAETYDATTTAEVKA